MTLNARTRLLAGLLFFAASHLNAQTDAATITGRVTDNTGAVVIGAQVQLISIERGTSQNATTNEAGIYLFPSVRPGQYRITVKHEGFSQVDFLGLVVNVQDRLAENFHLQVGSVSESVTVNGTATLANTQDASVSTVINRDLVSNLPLNGRSFNTLMQLTPGVVIAPTVQSHSSGQFSISGQRQDANNFTVDGVSANFGVGAGFGMGPSGTGNNQAFSALGGTSSLVSVDALEEFRIETSTTSPELGRNAGGQVILTTRSGTNILHGGAYEYFRNDVLDANDWFANQASVPRAKERHNDFGAFLGGPVWKDRTFFFLSYEGARLRLPQSGIQQVPSEFARQSAPSAIAPYLDAYPEPNDRSVVSGIYTAPFTGSFSNSATLNAGSVRVDHKFNDRVSIFARFNDAPSQILERANGANYPPSNLFATSVDTTTLTAGLNFAFDSRKINTIRGNYSTQNSNLTTVLDSFSGAIPPSSAFMLFGLSPEQNAGGFQTGDLTGRLSVGSQGQNKARQANLVDDFSWLLGSHQLKFGGDYRVILLDRNTPNYGASVIASTVQDLVTTGTANLFTSYTRPTQFLVQALSFYGQDTWSINPRLTITYGVRWEWAPAPSGRGDTHVVAWENTNNPSQITLAPAGTPIWNSSYANFAPRFGLAYRITSDGSLIARVGGGLFFDPGTGAFADSVLGLPNEASQSFNQVSLPINDIHPFLPMPPTLQPPFQGQIYGYSQKLKLPRSYQWNAAIEKTISQGQAITATYLGQAGRNLTRQEALFQPNANFQGEFLLTNNSSYSNYNALQVQYRRPLAHRLQALLNYTWSHSLDNASNDVADALSGNIVSNARDYAQSDFDVRHSFSGTVIFNVPGIPASRVSRVLTENWSIDTVIVARTGFPFNGLIFDPAVNPDPNGYATLRPDQVPGQPIYLTGATCASIFRGLGVLTAGQVCPGGRGVNPAALVEQSTTRQGTESRNNIPGFGLTQVDLSLERKFAVTERVSVQFRADAFNVLNHPTFTNPLALPNFGPVFDLSMQMLNQGLAGLNPLFQEGGPRSLQLSLKFSF